MHLTDAVIRMAQPEDAAEIAAIYAPYVLESTASFETEAPSAELIARRMALISGKLPWLVLWQNGQIAGYAYASRMGERPGYNWSCSASIYVRQNSRGTGVGSALYTCLEQLLTLQGFRNLFALVAHPNPASEAFHESRGYVRQGFLEHIGYKFGKVIGVIYYAKALLPVAENPPLPTPLADIPLGNIAQILGKR